MRLRCLFLWDIRFQASYGFYFLYAVLTALYAIAILAVPESWREKTAAILIFSDPASMGLFFMGAIVLLEKNQHIPCAFAVCPVRAAEYILAKIGSLSAISLVVAALLAFAANGNNVPLTLLGTALSSAAFTLLGMIAAAKITSLNQFILWTVPIEIVCFVPAMLHLFQITPAWLRYYPVNVCMDLISGCAPSAAGIFALAAWLAVLFVLAKRCVLKMWASMGGAKL